MRRKQLTALLLLTGALAGCAGMHSTQPDPGGALAEGESGEAGSTDGEGNPGAGSGAETITRGEEGTGAGVSDDPAAGLDNGAAVGEERTQAGQEQESVLPLRLCRGGMVLEDEEAFYLCTTEQIRRIQRKDGVSRILWERVSDPDQIFSYMEGSGILLGEYLYFLEEGQREPDGQEGRAFSVIRTDGSGYRRLAQLEDYPLALSFFDGGLYLEWAGGYTLCCPVERDGSPAGDEASGEMIRETHLVNVPQGYTPASVRRAGSSYIGAVESRELYGFYLLKNQDMEAVIVDPQTGEEKPVPTEGILRSLNQDYLLFTDYKKDREEVYLTDVKNLETRFLTSFDSREWSESMILDMDRDYVYVALESAEGNPPGDTVYKKIDLETGESTELFRRSRWVGMEGRDSLYSKAMAIEDGWIYYADVRDYKMYLMGRNLARPQEAVLLGNPLYESGIGQVGTVERYFERVYSQQQPDFVLAEMDLERLTVYERFQGAARINQFLTRYQEDIISYEKDAQDIKWREEEIASWEGEDIPPALSYSYTSRISPITFFDGDRFSFRQMDYDYIGGVHGMPYWAGFTFNLHTGERLGLSDVIENSEQELKDIVVRYFEEYMAQSPDGFWDDALTVVRDRTDLSSDFYLREDGICFYFGPYMLSSYAAGFQQVTIPFEEFEMKIPVTEAEKGAF